MQRQKSGRCTLKDLEELIAKCEKNGKSYDDIDLSDARELTESDFDRGQFKYYKPAKKMIVRMIAESLCALP